MTRSSKTVIDLTGDSDDSAPARRSNRSNRAVGEAANGKRNGGNTAAQGSNAAGPSTTKHPNPTLNPTHQQSGWHDQLKTLVKSQLGASSGSFAVTGTVTGSLKKTLPSMSVEGVGAVQLPLSKQQAVALEAAGEAAPYGLGELTVYNTHVRHAFQFNPDKVQVGDTWSSTLADIKNKSLAGLGLTQEQSSTVAVNLYKLLLYPPGGHFAAHRDTEKEPGMFATLIVQLPAGHVGGALHIRHEGKEVVWATDKDSGKRIQYCAFYADCEHQLSPVAKGWRLVLVYNLVYTNPITAAPTANATTHDLQQAVAAWLADTREDKLARVAVKLEHQYTTANLSFGNLKGHDRDVAQLFLSCKQLDVRLVLMERTIIGMAEEEDPWAHRYPYDDYDEGEGDEDESDECDESEMSDQGSEKSEGDNKGKRGKDKGRGESKGAGGKKDGKGKGEPETPDSDKESDDPDFSDIIEVTTDTTKGLLWVSPEGPLDTLYAPVDNAELLNDKKVFRNSEQAEEGDYETTGNEGASREYWYHRAVLVAWPKSLRLSVAEAGGFNALVELLVQTLQDHTWWQSGAQDGSRAAALPQPQQQSGQPQQSARAKRSRSSGASADGNDGSLGEAKGSKKRKTEQRATAIAAEQPTQLAAGNAGVQPAQPAAISTGARPGQQPEVPGQADRGRGQLRLGAVTAVLTAMLKALKDDKCLMVQEVDRWGYQERSRNADVAAFIRATDALVPATDVPDALQLVQKTAAQLLHALSSGDFDLDSNVCDSLVALVAKMSDRNVNQALLSVIKNAASTRISYQPIMPAKYMDLLKHKDLPKRLRPLLAMTGARTVLKTQDYWHFNYAYLKSPFTSTTMADFLVPLLFQAPSLFKGLQATLVSKGAPGQEVLAALLQSPRMAAAVEQAGGLTPYLAGLFGARMAHLETDIAKGHPEPFSWRMPQAKCTRSAALEAFFRGPNQSITFTDPETVKVVRKAVSVPEMRYRSVEDATFTKHNTYKGGGVVTITKTREWYDKRLAAYKTRSAAALEELSKLTPLMNKLIVELVYRQW